jgi:DNA-directed RNA polymerase sigma subunit (sigma70/sigma32)
MINMQNELEGFLVDLYTDDLKKKVLLARANGETLEEVGRRLGVTREFVRQIEAKITRRFAMSQIGRKSAKA